MFTKRDVTRGVLLRDIGRLSTEILVDHKRLQEVNQKCAAGRVERDKLIASLDESTESLKQLELQKKTESSDDKELISLQRAVGIMTTVRQDLVKNTKQSRLDREKIRDETTSSYYSTIGAILEQKLMISSLNGSLEPVIATESSQPVWDSDSLKVLSSIDSLWRKVSSQGTVVRDLLEYCLDAHGVQFADKMVISTTVIEENSVDPTPLPASGTGGLQKALTSTPASGSYDPLTVSPTSGSSTMFKYHSEEVVAAEIEASLDVFLELSRSCLSYSNSLNDSISRELDATGSDAVLVPLRLLRSLLNLMKQNIAQSVSILCSLERVNGSRYFEPTEDHMNMINLITV